MKAIRRFTVRTHLPESIGGLGRLATNLRWSWHPQTKTLFRELFKRGNEQLERLDFDRYPTWVGPICLAALYLILVAHTAAVPGGPGIAATCAECRPERRESAGRYPCPTAQQAFWALDASLR